jgi:2-succinyl-5-enolpyruvyl-6-hydroxy-3-cyclohexene-1-carboxylate synthase
VSPGPPSSPQLAEANVQAALTLLASLRHQGLQHLVLCPGSRSAPLAVAAALLESVGLRLHTAVDERSAAFFALGMGRASGVPAAVVTTSGSAVAHLLPAAVEADHGTIPLLLISADRPSRLKGCGANQSVNQEEFLACSCRWSVQGPGGGLAHLATAELEQLAVTAMAHCLGDGRCHPPGAVHLNLPFEEPLHIAGPSLRCLAAQGLDPSGHLPWPRRSQLPAAGVGEHGAGEPDQAPLDPDRPGLVLAGPWRGHPSRWDGHVRALCRWQERSGWPVCSPVCGVVTAWSWWAGSICCCNSPTPP